jgi:hypothetical protein
MPVFYATLSFSVLFSTLAVVLKYLTIKGFFNRMEENKLKREQYLKIVADRNNLR